jgi:hypothetical protein
MTECMQFAARDDRCASLKGKDGGSVHLERIAQRAIHNT